MRDYGKVDSVTWTDYRGRVWPVVTSRHRLKFKIKSHAALRAHVFHMDNYRCVRCHAQPEPDRIPFDYDGRSTLFLGGKDRGGLCLMLDHKRCLAAGGSHHVSNFQTLCESCNCAKGSEDKRQAAAVRQEAAYA
jgi:5-methylcytosine-specific restriction endonuclease McrA